MAETSPALRQWQVRPTGRRRPLRGRDAELGCFADVLRTAVARGQGMAVSIVAAAGTGKTALLTEMAGMAQAQGFRVTRLGLDEEFRSDILARRLRDADVVPDDLRVVLESRLARAPLLVTLDNLRWSEPTVSTLETLFSLLTTRPLVCALARRPDEHSQHLDQLIRYVEDRDAVVHLPLPRMSEDAVVAVVEDMLGAVPNEEFAELVACAEGNPGALVDLVDGLGRGGFVRREQGIAFLSNRDGAAVPECLAGLVQRRLDELSPQTRQALDVAAVLGRTFAPDDVAKLLHQPIAALAPACREAVSAGLIESAAERMRFRRESVWRVVLQRIPESVRNALHHQAARLLFTRGGSVVDMTEHVLLGATGHDPLTLEMLRRAAEQALEAAPRAAAKLASRGLELISVDSVAWLPLTMIAVESCTRAGPVPRAVELATGAIRQGVPPEAGDALRYWLANALTLQGKPVDGVEPAPEHTTRLALNAAMADTVHSVPADAPPPPSCAMRAWQAGMVTTALRLSDEAMRTDDARGPVTWIGHPRLVRAAILTALRDVDGARAAITDVGHDIDPALCGLPTLLSARLDLVCGRLANAMANASESLAVARETGVRVYLPAALAVLTTVSSRRADLAAKVAEHGLAAWAAREVSGKPSVTLAWARAQLTFAEGGSDPALELVCRDSAGHTLLFVEEPVAAAWLVRAALAMGDRDWAMTALDTAERLAGDNRGVRVLEMSALHARGVLHGDIGALARAAEAHVDPWGRASATEDLGAVLAGRDREAAVSRLEAAAALYESIGAERDRARIRRRLRELGVVKRHWRARDRPGTGVAGLTETERAVAVLVATGLTNKQVAARMFISPHTVAFHLRKVFRKLDVSSRIELARLIPPDGG
jgi:DNA-binding CsgD family transcriptional regulator